MHTLKPGQVFRPGAAEGISDQLSPLSVTSSFFMQDRARFNESAITTLNQLWRTAEDTDLRFNVNYGFEREKRDRTVKTEYHFENIPSIILNDYTSQTVNWHKLENELAYTANKSEYHLEEKLNVNIHWKDAVADVLSNDYIIRQQMDLPRLHLKNSTSFTKLLGNTALGISNNSEFTRLPQSLTITSPDSIPLFSSREVNQSVTFTDGFSNTFATINFKVSRNVIDVKAGVEWIWQDIDSFLEPIPDLDELFVNDQKWRSMRLYIEPSHKFMYRWWTLNTSLSGNYMRTDYNGERDNYYYVNPRFRVVYEPNGSLKLNAGYSRNIRYGNLNQMQTGYIMKRYNLFSKGLDELQRSATQNITWGVNYKNISHFFNLNYIGSYSKYANNYTSASFIRDIYSFSWWELGGRSSDFWMNMFSATRLITSCSLTAGLSLSYNRSNSVIEQQGVEIDYTNHTYTISPSLKWNARNNLNLDYSMNAAFSGVSVNNNPVDKYIPLVNHKLYSFFGVSDKLSLNSNIQHFYNKSPNASVSNLVFADIGLQYLFKKVTVNLDWTNIFNQKEHITSSYSTINAVTRIDKLRPSEILLSFRFKR